MTMTIRMRIRMSLHLRKRVPCARACMYTTQIQAPYVHILLKTLKIPWIGKQSSGFLCFVHDVPWHTGMEIPTKNLASKSDFLLLLLLKDVIKGSNWREKHIFNTLFCKLASIKLTSFLSRALFPHLPLILFKTCMFRSQSMMIIIYVSKDQLQLTCKE